MHEKKVRGCVSSFIEGLIQPIIDLLTSLFVSLTATGLLTIEETTQELIRTFSETLHGAQPSFQVGALNEVFSITIVIIGIIDLLWNLIIGFLAPGDALAHLIGEVIAFSFIFPLITLPLFSQSLASIIASIALISIGIIVRVYLEYEVTRESEEGMLY